MNAEEQGAADGQVRSDHAWSRRLRLLLESTVLQPTLVRALLHLSPTIAVDMDLLLEVVEEQAKEWRLSKHMERLGLPEDFLQFALAIYVYTLEDPAIYKIVNKAMFEPSRRVKGAPSGPSGSDLSNELSACAPYIKFLDEALRRLPARFRFRGRVQRGVKWVYPSPDNHDPESYFRPGAILTW
jgi:hypothetical protein